MSFTTLTVLISGAAAPAARAALRCAEFFDH